MKVAVTGSHGLIGSELVAELGRRGDQVTRLVRATPGPGEAAWDPAAGTIEADNLEQTLARRGPMERQGSGIAATSRRLGGWP